MTHEMYVRGGVPLRGSVRIKGAKNAGLPVIAASLLVDEPVILEEIPDLMDVQTMLALVNSLGAAVKYDSVQEIVSIHPEKLSSAEPPQAFMQKMRASFLVLGPLLARYGRARLSLPGGCAIGSRPVDLHLKGLEAMGVKFSINNGLVEGKVNRLRGSDIYLDYPSVGATENLIMAAVLASGPTIIENAATEPEIVDLANFLNSAGAKIKGAGTGTVRIRGVSQLGGTRHTVIPDRIEAGTFILSAAVTGGDIIVTNVLADHLKPLIAKVRETGVEIEEAGLEAIRVKGRADTRCVDLKTRPYPGFPTDLQPQFMVLLALSRGMALVTETVFENRYRYISGLNRMGADIQVDGRCAVVHGNEKLSGAPVEATDLRGAAALVLAALAAEGESRISGLEHLQRGYSSFAERLVSLGAQIRLENCHLQRKQQAAGE